MALDPLQEQLSSAAGQAEFLREKIIRPIEERHGVELQEDPALAALTRTLEENPTVAALRAAFESVPDLRDMFPEVSDEDLEALRDLFQAGTLPDSLQAILDAISRLNADRGSGLGSNFDRSG